MAEPMVTYLVLVRSGTRTLTVEVRGRKALWTPWGLCIAREESVINSQWDFMLPSPYVAGLALKKCEPPT